MQGVHGEGSGGGNWNRPEPRALTAIIVIVTLGFRGLGYRVLFVDDVFTFLLSLISHSWLIYRCLSFRIRFLISLSFWEWPQSGAAWSRFAQSVPRRFVPPLN